MIYFIEAEGLNRVKIGYVANDSGLEPRLRTIQCYCPVPAKLVGVLDGDQSLERNLHSRLAKHRVVGEWFAMELEVKRVLNLASRGGCRLTIGTDKKWTWTTDETVLPLTQRFTFSFSGHLKPVVKTCGIAHKIPTYRPPEPEPEPVKPSEALEDITLPKVDWWAL